jgi:hypothetical protein
VLIGVGTFFKPYVLKPNPNLPTLKSVKDRRSTINLPKCSRIDSLEKVSMTKTHRGSTIDDNFIVVKMIVVTFLDFPDPDKAHRASSIDDFFTSFVNVCLSHIFRCRRGSAISRTFMRITYANQNPPSTDVDEDRCSTTVVLCGSFTYLNYFPMPNLSALGAVFSC